MKGERRLLSLCDDLRAVTPQTVTIRRAPYSVEFKGHHVIARDERIDQEPREWYGRHPSHRVTTNTEGLPESMIAHVREKVKEHIHQTRLGYAELIVSVRPEDSLRLLDGEKVEDAMVSMVGGILTDFAEALPTPALIHSMTLIYDDPQLNARSTFVYNQRVGWETMWIKQIAVAVAFVQNLPHFLRWGAQVVHAMEAMAKAGEEG